MLKPHLLRPVAGEIQNQTEQMKAPEPLFGAGAAGFARSILERADGEALYPEVWLELLHQQQAEEAAARGDTQLTELTVNLALELTENLQLNKVQQEIHNITEQNRQNQTNVAVNPTEKQLVRQITTISPRREHARKTDTIAVLKPMIGLQGAAGPRGRAGTQGLAEHKREFLRILQQADREEQERIWTLTTESSELAVRDLRPAPDEQQRDTGERLRQLVTRFTEREYRQWLELLHRELTIRQETKESSMTETHSEQVVQQLQQAAPALEILRRALSEKRMVRETLLQEIRDLPEKAEQAFLLLSEESGAIHKTRNHREEELTETERLETLIRKTRRQELSELLEWTTKKEREYRLDKENFSRESNEAESRHIHLEERESVAMRQLKTLLQETKLQRRTRVQEILEQMSEEERAVLNTAARSRLPVREQLPENRIEHPLVYLMEQSTDPEALAEELLETPEVKKLIRENTLEQTVYHRLTEFTRSRGEDRKILTERLLNSLNTTEQRLLLNKLDQNQLIQKTAEIHAETDLRQQLETQLTFRTQKEFKSFRYQLNQLLQREEAPKVLQLQKLQTLAAEQKRFEREQLKTGLKELTGARPAAWKRAVLGEEQAEKADARPLEFQEETLAKLAAGRGPIYHRLSRLLEESPPRGIVEEELTALLRTLPRTSIAKAAQQETAPRTVSRKTAPLELLKPIEKKITGAESREKLIQLIARDELPVVPKIKNTVRTRQLPVKQSLARNIQKRTPPVIHRTTEAGEIEAAMVHHSLPSVSRQTARQLAAHAAEEAETLIRRVNEETLTQQKLAGPKQLVEHLERHTLEQILLHIPAEIRENKQTETRWALPRAARVHRKPAVLSALEPDTSPQNIYSDRGETVMALRREGTGTRPEEQRRTAEKTVEIAVAKQAPQIQLLRTQQQEGSVQLRQQAQEIKSLRQQLEEQTALVHKAVENSSREAAQQPQQLRTMVRSVMKEMEGQLRLERQRRGLS